MLADFPERSPGRPIPEASCPVHTARQNGPAVRAERYAEDLLAMRQDRPDGLPGRHLPESCGAVKTSSQNGPAIRAKRYGQDTSSGMSDSVKASAGLGVPEFGLSLIAIRIQAPGCRGPTIGAECDRPHGIVIMFKFYDRTTPGIETSYVSASGVLVRITATCQNLRTFGI